jgi:hypothetical protein
MKYVRKFSVSGQIGKFINVVVVVVVVVAAAAAAAAAAAKY